MCSTAGSTTGTIPTATSTLPWFSLNRLRRISDSGGVVTFVR
ncbi:hypothetical protein [Nonomuraea sp. NPDC049480]